MTKSDKGLLAPASVKLNYQLLRNTTSPDEQSSGVKSFVANLPCFEILKLGTKENLRSYIAEYNPRKRNRVHIAIRDTIEQIPERFITRNSGFVIAASAIDVDDAKKTVRLKDASVVNGAQSQGEIQAWVNDTYEEGADLDAEDVPFYVRAEIIVDEDSEEVVETAIARNTATPVKSISQAGARGHLDELGERVAAAHHGLKIRKSETDVGPEFYDTRKVIQYARLLMPASVSGNDSPSEKLRPYKNPEQCLSDFSKWYETKGVDPDACLKYDFTVAMAPTAISEYEYWEANDAWNGNHIWTETKKGGRACRRDESGKIIWVSPGLVFPLLGALSEFVVTDKKHGWVLKKPDLFKPSQMIKRTLAQFRSLDSDPMQMGRSAGVYDALRIYPATIVQVMKEAHVK